ncbi:hypothetical protein FA10DRAFT_264663 [Acaromyces ingoldii]|uniref:Vacuolar membrane protein n=1 Tax=Acaromyces ingoldii TaxID=215250 RepID=A0A316Z1L6_9BASI|nr:hypothetical protein FA10DRAFT_264663 [Acaromyces ingoldii]PWN94073.1 hypothetical protein FA10DRAFT_264663 [Acaromyces ingoldii]
MATPATLPPLSSSMVGLPEPDPNDPSNRNCRLLGPFALFVQALMGVVVVGTLVLKRQRERPKRPWKIWLLDISKQMLGQLFVHTLNVALSSLGSLASEGEENPCSLYFLNIAIDTTLGVFIIYASMRFLTHYFTDVLGWPGFVSGQYTSTPLVLGRRRRRGPRAGGSLVATPRASTDTQLTYDEASASSSPMLPTSQALPKQSISQDGEATAGASSSHPPEPLATTTPASTTTTAGLLRRGRPRPRLTFFFRQLSLYLLSLLIMKILVVLLLALFPFLFDVGRWILDLFGHAREAQVLFVMALFPLAMNTLQFWLIDSLLRHNPHTTKYQSEEDAAATGAMLDGHDGHGGEEEEREGDEDLEGGIGGGGNFAFWAAPAARRGGAQAGAGAGTGAGAGVGAGAGARYGQLANGDEGLSRHLVGIDSDDDEEEGEGETDPHAYPPPRSERGSSNEDEARGPARHDGRGAGDDARAQQQTGSLLSPSPLTTTSAAQEQKKDDTAAAGTTAAPALGDDEDDMWDSWDDDGGAGAPQSDSGATVRAKPSDIKRD